MHDIIKIIALNVVCLNVPEDQNPNQDEISVTTKLYNILPNWGKNSGI